MDNKKLFSNLWLKIKKASCFLKSLGLSIGGPNQFLNGGLLNQLLRDILSLLKLHNVSLLFSTQVKLVLLECFTYISKQLATSNNMQNFLDDYIKSIDNESIIGSLDHSTNNYPFLSLLFFLSRYQGIIEKLSSSETSEQYNIKINKIENYLNLLLVTYFKGGHIGNTRSNSSFSGTGSSSSSNRGGNGYIGGSGDDDQFVFSEDEGGDDSSPNSGNSNSSSNSGNSTSSEIVKQTQKLKSMSSELMISVFFKFYSLYFEKKLYKKIIMVETKTLLSLFCIELSNNTTTDNLSIIPLSSDKVKSFVDHSLKWINRLSDLDFNTLLSHYQLLSDKFIFFKYYLKSNENVFLSKKSRVISILNVSNQSILQLELVDALVDCLFNDYGNSDGDNEDIEILNFIIDIVSNVQYISDTSKQKIGNEIFSRFILKSDTTCLSTIQNNIDDDNNDSPPSSRHDSMASYFFQEFSNCNKKQPTTLFQSLMSSIFSPVFHKNSTQYSLKYFFSFIVSQDFKILVSDADLFLDKIKVVSGELGISEYFEILCKTSSIKLTQHILCDLSLSDLLDFSTKHELLHLNSIGFRFALKNYIDKFEKNNLNESILNLFNDIIKFEKMNLTSSKVNNTTSSSSSKELIHYKSICSTLIDIVIGSSLITSISIADQIETSSLIWLLLTNQSIDYQIQKVLEFEYRLNNLSTPPEERSNFIISISFDKIFSPILSLSSLKQFYLNNEITMVSSSSPDSSSNISSINNGNGLWLNEYKKLSGSIIKVRDNLLKRCIYFEESFEPMYIGEYQNLVVQLKDFFKDNTTFQEVPELIFNYHNDRMLYPLFKKYTEYMKRFGFNIKDFTIESRKLHSQILSYSNLFKKKLFDDDQVSYIIGNTKAVTNSKSNNSNTISKLTTGNGNSSGSSEGSEDDDQLTPRSAALNQNGSRKPGPTSSSLNKSLYRQKSNIDSIIESIKYIGYFRLNRVTIFSILFEEYSLKEKNLNSIIELVDNYFRQLIPKSNIDQIKISINPLLDRIINDPSIDFKRELSLIYQFLYPNESEIIEETTPIEKNPLSTSRVFGQEVSSSINTETDDTESEFFKIFIEILKIFENSKRYFIFCKDIEHFNNFILESEFISISNLNQYHLELQSLKSIEFTNVRLSMDIENRIQQLIGINSIYHLQLFQGINRQLMDWFSKFSDIQNFVSQCQMINDRISMELDRSENSNLINNADYAFKSTHRIVQYYRIYKKSLKDQIDDKSSSTTTTPVPVPKLTKFENVYQFFETSFGNDSPSSFNILVTVFKNLDKIKVIFESYTLDDSKNIAKIVQLIVKEKSQFISFSSKSLGQPPGWFIQINGSTVKYSQDLIDDLYRGLELGSQNQQQNKDNDGSSTTTNATEEPIWIELFRQLYKNIKKIHKIHQQLDEIYHPGYPNGRVEVIVDCSLPNTDPLSLFQKIVSLKTDYRDWRDKMKDLPRQVLLLKNKGISSFYSKVDQFLKSVFKSTSLPSVSLTTVPSPISRPAPINIQEMLSKENVSIFSSLIYPYVKYCFPLIEIDENLIFSTINKNILLKSTNNSFEFLKVFFDFFATELKLKFNFELNPKVQQHHLHHHQQQTIQLPLQQDSLSSSSTTTSTLQSIIILKCENFENVYNSLFLVNGNKIPHPSQIFYTSQLESFDFQHLDEIQNLGLPLNYFLIGIPQNKDDLFKWVSKKYNGNSNGNGSNAVNHHNMVSKIFIVVKENRELIEFFTNIKQMEVKDADWSQFKNYWLNIHNTIGVGSISILTGNGKTHFIKSELNERKSKYSIPSISIHIRPNWNCATSIVEHLSKYVLKSQVKFNTNSSLSSSSNNNNSPNIPIPKQRISLYIYISSYYNFNEFNEFIYPLITYGFIVNENGEIFNLSNGLLLDIYIEIGSVLNIDGEIENFDDHQQLQSTTTTVQQPQPQQPQQSIQLEKEYIKKSIPLLYYIGLVKDSSKPWECNNLIEKKCFRYLYYIKEFNFDFEGTIEFYQKPQPVNTSSMDKEGYGLLEFIKDLKQLLSKQFPLEWDKQIQPYIDFLGESNQYLVERKNFFSLLSEKLEYMDVYIDNSINHCNNIGSLLPWILLECLVLTCPNFSMISSKHLWSNPPTISKTHLDYSKTRIVKDKIESTSVRLLEFIDFNNNMELYSKSLNKYSTLNIVESEWKLNTFNLLAAASRKKEFFKLVARFFKIYDSDNSMIIEKLCLDSGYILTPEFALRLIILHDRLRYQKSVVMVGGTGVGKTKLLYFYSLILNFQFVEEAQKEFNKQLIEEINRIIDKRESATHKIKSTSHLYRIPEVIDDLTKEKPIAAKDFLNSLVEFILKQLDKNHLVHKNHPQLEYYRQKFNYRAVSLSDAKMFSKLACNQLNYIKVYHRFVMHLKYTSSQFKQTLQSIFIDANHLLSMKSDIKILVFIDEFNTSPTDTLSLINEIFMDKTIDGESIPSNIYWIGAMNPLSKIKSVISQQQQDVVVEPSSSLSTSSTSTTTIDNNSLFNNKKLSPLLDFTGVEENDKFRDQVYMVQPTPPSMNKIVFNFGEFKQDNEKPFLDCLFEIKHSEMDQNYSRHLIVVINECQSFLRSPVIINSKIHPSIRDIMRASKLYDFFTTNSIGVQILLSSDFFSDEERQLYFSEKNKQQTLNLSLSTSSSGIGVAQQIVPTHLLNKDVLHWSAIILTVFIAYYLRIPVTYRSLFKEKLKLCFDKILLPTIFKYKSTNNNNNNNNNLNSSSSSTNGLTNSNGSNGSNNSTSTSQQPITFSKIYKEILRSFSEKIKSKIPKGVALTQSLQLNIFTMIVSINVGIPLLIIGPPGSSKTISLGIVIDIMNDNNVVNQYSDINGNNGNDNNNNILNQSPPNNLTSSTSNNYNLITKKKPFDYNNGFYDMSNIYTLKYQFTPHSSDEEIKSKYTQALQHQDFFQHTKHVVFLDEAGLIKEEDNPMKILHDYLDKEQHMSTDQNISNIETIILSNKILDAAKNNRMLILFHSETIHEKDEEILVGTCLPMIHKISDKREQIKITQALCKGYRVSNQFTESTKQNLFFQRDFVFFLRHLNRSLETKDTTLITPEILLESLERNFNGIPHEQFKKLASVFLNELGFNLNDYHIKRLLSRDNTIIRIKESLEEKLDLTNNPNNSAFRFIMVIDPSDNESSLAILKEITNSNSKVIRVGGFKDDQTISSLVDLFSEIKKEMSQGGTVILVNTSIINQCFYDVFNRYFITLSSTDNETTLWATISFGSHTAHQRVHPNFKIVVLQPLSNIKNVQLPWLNRFETYQLSTETFVNYYLDNVLSPFDKDIFNTLLSSTNQLISLFNQNEKYYLFGYQEKETIISIIFNFIRSNRLNSTNNNLLNFYNSLIVNDDNNNDNGSSSGMMVTNNNERSPISQINLKLLLLGRPERIFHTKFLPESYLKEYLLGQEHFNIFRFLQHQNIKNNSCNNGTSSSSPTWLIYTRSSIDLFNINEDLMNFEFSQLLNSTSNGGESKRSSIKIKKLFKVFQVNSFKSSISFKKKFNEFLLSTPQQSADFDDNDDYLSVGEIQTAIIIADMNETNNSQINFIVNSFDTKKFNQLKKNVILICHYPPEYSISNQVKFSVNYLHQMEYLYVDSLGIKFNNINNILFNGNNGNGGNNGSGGNNNGKPIIGHNDSSSNSISGTSSSLDLSFKEECIDSDVRNWIAFACGLDINLDTNSIYSILEKPLLNQINLLIKQTNIKFDSEYDDDDILQLSSNNGSTVITSGNSTLSNVDEIVQDLSKSTILDDEDETSFDILDIKDDMYSIFSKHSIWCKEIIQLFISNNSGNGNGSYGSDNESIISNIFNKIVSDCSQSVLSGCSMGKSFSDSIKDTMNEYLQPIVFKVLHSILSQQNIVQLQSINVSSDHERLVLLYIKSIKLSDKPLSLETIEKSKFEQIQVNYHYKESNLPLYDSISELIQNQIEQILIQYQPKNINREMKPKELLKKLEDSIQLCSFNELIQFIESNQDIKDSLVEDFIIRTLKILKPSKWMKLFKDIIEILSKPLISGSGNGSSSLSESNNHHHHHHHHHNGNGCSGNTQHSSFLKYFVLFHYQKPLLSFLNDITNCLYSIFEKDSKKNRDQLQKELLSSIKGNSSNENVIQLEIIKLIIKRFDSRFNEFYNDKKKPIDDFISSLGDWTMEFSIILNVLSMNQIFKNLKSLEYQQQHFEMNGNGADQHILLFENQIKINDSNESNKNGSTSSSSSSSYNSSNGSINGSIGGSINSSTKSNGGGDSNNEEHLNESSLLLSKAINIHYNYQISLAIFINHDNANKDDFLTSYNLSFIEIFEKCKSKKHLMLDILRAIIPLKIQNITEFLMIYNSQLYNHLLPDSWVKQVVCDIFEKTSNKEIEEIIMKMKEVVEPMIFIPDIYLDHFDWFNIRFITEHTFTPPINYPLIQLLYRSLLQVTRNQNGNNIHHSKSLVNINDLIKYQLIEESPFSKLSSIALSRNLMDRLIDHLYNCYIGINQNIINVELLKSNLSSFKDSLYLTFILNPDNENNYIQNSFNQLYFLSEVKYISTKHLDTILDCQDLMDMLGLVNISKLRSTNNETYLLLVNIIKSHVDSRDLINKTDEFYYRYQLQPVVDNNNGNGNDNGSGTEINSLVSTINILDQQLFEKEFPLIKYFETNLKTLSLSVHFENLIKFITMFRKFFFKRLPRDFIHKSIQEAFNYLLDFESKESITPLLNSWNQCKISYNNYILDVQQPQSNQQTTPTILHDNLPISFLICHYSFIGGSKKLLSKDLISIQIDKWQNTVRDLIIHKDNYLLENDEYIRMEFKQIFGSHLKNQFRNYIGSNYLEYNQFLTQLKQQQDQQKVTGETIGQDSIVIQNKLISLFISQKRLKPNIKKNLLQDEFPFSWKRFNCNDSNNGGSNISNFNNIYPDSIKTLKQLLNNGLEYDLSNKFAQDDEFKEFCKTIPFNQLISISQYLVETILLFSNLDHNTINSGNGNTGTVNNISIVLLKKILEFNPLNPIIHSNLPDEFIKLIETTCIGSIFQISKHVVNNCSIFDRLYTGIVHEPKSFEEIHVTNIKEIEKLIFNSVDTNQNYLFKWIETISGIVTSLSLPFVKQLVSNQKIKFKDLANSFINSSLIYNLVIDLPITYYPMFMRSLVKILTSLHLNSQKLNQLNNNQIKYLEPKWEIKIRPIQTLKPTNSNNNNVRNTSTGVKIQSTLSPSSSSSISTPSIKQVVNNSSVIQQVNKVVEPSIQITQPTTNTIKEIPITNRPPSPPSPHQQQLQRQLPTVELNQETIDNENESNTDGDGFNYKVLYDRNLFISFLNEKTKFTNEFKNNLSELGIDCYSVVLNLKKEDWISIKIPLSKRNELINLVKLEIPENVKREYQFNNNNNQQLDLQCSTLFTNFLIDVIGLENQQQVTNELGFESLLSIIPDGDEGFDELISELLILLKPATCFNLINQLKEIKLK